MGICNGEPVQCEAVRSDDRRRGAALCKLNAQGIANTVWGFANLNQSNVKLFVAAANGAVQHMNEFNTQGIADMAWAFVMQSRANRSGGE